MLVFPNCKINLGLHVVNKRADGYHAIETVFYPLNWCDALEILDGSPKSPSFVFNQSGIIIDGPPENNLLFKAWQLLNQETKCPPIRLHLHKNIPMGAGLGGGSADAAYFISAMSQKFRLDLDEHVKTRILSKLGSDCAFFLKNRPLFALGKGDEFTNIQIDLSQFYILAVYPGIRSNTKEAYQGLVPKKPGYDLRTLLEKTPLSAWKDQLTNDFEPSIFKKYPEVRALKESLYTAGAHYASMSGSGSTVFGIFDHAPKLSFPANYSYCLQKPSSLIL